MTLLRYTTPPGCRTYQSGNQCDTLAGSWDLAMPYPRVIGATPLDPGLNSGHPQGVLRYPILHDGMNGFCVARVHRPQRSTPGRSSGYPVRGTTIAYPPSPSGLTRESPPRGLPYADMGDVVVSGTDRTGRMPPSIKILVLMEYGLRV